VVDQGTLEDDVGRRVGKSGRGGLTPPEGHAWQGAVQEPSASRPE
jgi:hypothetical protein